MQKRTKLKHQLHQKKQHQYHKKVVHEIQHQKPLPNQVSMLHQMPYPVNMTSKNLSQFYNQQVKPVVDAVVDLPIQYNPNDNRVLLHEADLIKVADGRSLFGGFVIRAGCRIVDNDVRIQILVKDVSGLVTSKSTSGTFTKLTDHVWLDINDYQNDFLDDVGNLEIGLGDYLLFGGEVSPYHGTKNHIKYTKFDITNVTILNCGFPCLTSNNKHDLISVNMRKCINYVHHNHFIVRIYNKFKFPHAFPVFGDQIARMVQHRQYDPQYHFGNQKLQIRRPVIAQGFKFERPYYLHFYDDTLYWSQDKTDAIFDNQELKRVGLRVFYQRVVNKYHIRYERYRLPDDKIALAEMPNRLRHQNEYVKRKQKRKQNHKHKKRSNPPKSWINDIKQYRQFDFEQKDD